MISQWARFLCFRLNGEEIRSLSWQVWLGPGIVATWLAGMGRYWDHPQASLLQMWGLGSLAYVFLLGALLWLVLTPLKPRAWNYLQVVTLISLTAPLAFLYAIPVERFLSVATATSANAWFLATVAAWRVALLVVVLRRHAELTWPRTIVGALLPLAVIVSALSYLNLEKAVFELMGGFHEGTANDGAYLVVLLLTVLSSLLGVPLLFVYFGLVWRVRLEVRHERESV